MDAHRDCPKCSGKAVIWMNGNEIFRVTARKDENNEVEEFICNDCRFERKDPADWTIEGPRKIKRTSIISVNHYQKMKNAAIINPVNKIIEKPSEI